MGNRMTRNASYTTLTDVTRKYTFESININVDSVSPQPNLLPREKELITPVDVF